MKYQYKITHISRDERWISISSNGEFDCEDPESFLILLKRIKDSIGGEIEDIGDTRYLIRNDGFGLIYQWDDCFGIYVIYPRNVTEKPIINFLEQYF